jgi:hypothetical protein
VTPKQQSIAAGSEASFTIAVSPATVPGTDTVSMYDFSAATNSPGGVASGTLLGTATYSSTNLDWTFTTTTPLAAGTHTIEAVFSGDTTYASSYGLAGVTVVPIATTTTVTPKQQSIAAGSEASFTITVSPATASPVTGSPVTGSTLTVPSADKVWMYDVSPAGNAPGGVAVTTYLGTATYDSTNLDWTFTTTTPLTVGTHTIEAVFSGDTEFAPSYGLASVTVLPAPTTPAG